MCTIIKANLPLTKLLPLDQHGQGAQSRAHYDYYRDDLRRLLAAILPYVRHTAILQQVRTTKLEGETSQEYFCFVIVMVWVHFIPRQM